MKVKGGTEVLVGRELTFTEARVRVSMGLDLMCANEDAEKAMLFANGYVHAVGPEIHGATGTIRIFIRIDTLIHISGFIHKFYKEDESVSNS